MELVNIDQNFYTKTLPALLANGALVVYALLRAVPLRRYLVFFGMTTLLDIAVAGQLIPIGNAELQTTLEYLFVLIGDLRFILLLAYILYAGKTLFDIEKLQPNWDVLRPAIIFTLFPSLIVSAIGFACPDWVREMRQKFFAYEITFFVLTVLWIYVVMPQKNVARREQVFLKRAAQPVLVFYGLWALADMLLLKGIAAGHALRIVPNVVYYCVFLWWIAYAAYRYSRV